MKEWHVLFVHSENHTSQRVTDVGYQEKSHSGGNFDTIQFQKAENN